MSFHPDWYSHLSTNDICLTLLAMESMYIDIFLTATSKTFDVPNKAHILLDLTSKLVKEVHGILTSE